MSEFTKHFCRLNYSFRKVVACINIFIFPFFMGFGIGGIGFFSRLFKWLNFAVRDQDTGY